MASEEEMAEMHKLSNDYALNDQGPDVGHRQSSQAIADRYSRPDTDRIYVVKTKALCTKYGFFRPVKGDGNCGWRALAFGYFEALLHAAHRSIIDEERARLEFLNRMLDDAGHPKDLYEDFTQYTFDLLEAIGKRLSHRDSRKDLLDRFNEDGVSSAIITHFRLVTSAWLKSNSALYQAFLLEDITIDQYCAAQIEPYQVEIDHLGMNACIEAILKPAGISVEVAYLDRSPGEQMNTFHWQGDPLNGRAGFPTVRLLYRPGHYDLLYTSDDYQTILPRPVEVRYVHEIPQPTLMDTFPISWELDLAFTDIPGFSLVPVDTPFYDDSPPNLLLPVFEMPGLIIHSPPGPSPDPHFRRSIWQDQGPYPQMEPCTTEPMKQAGECPGHYKNPHFQPILWDCSEYKSVRDSDPNLRR